MSVNPSPLLQVYIIAFPSPQPLSVFEFLGAQVVSTFLGVDALFVKNNIRDKDAERDVLQGLPLYVVPDMPGDVNVYIV